MQTRPGQYLSNLRFPHAWEERLELADDGPNEVREPVHGLMKLNQSMLTLLVDSLQRGHYRLWIQNEGIRRLADGPPSSSFDLQYPQPLDRLVVQPSAWMIPPEALILDGHLLLEQGNLAVCSTKLCP
jgi:hypothetical protein